MRSTRRVMMPPLLLTITATTGRSHQPRIRKFLTAAHQILHPPLAELSVALVGDRRMGQLHQEFMNIPGPTDVLTFPLELDSRGRPTSGEVVVCVPEAVRQARRHGTRVPDELLLYALHGLLHLCGFDDRTEADFSAMHAQEDSILSRLGVGRVFAPTLPGPADPVARKTAPRRPAHSPKRPPGRAPRRAPHPARRGPA